MMGAVPPGGSQRDLRSTLAQLRVFEGCSDELMAYVNAGAETRVFRHEEVLCREGEPAEELFVALKGQVTVTFDNVFLVPRGAGEVIGEQAFINGTPRGATVTAQGMVEALVIPRAVVERLMDDAQFGRNILRVLSDKLAQSTEDRAFNYRYEHLLFGAFRSHVSPQVLQELLRSGENYGAPRHVLDAVIMFADIRGFTGRSAAMDPETVASQLGAFLDAAVTVVHEHGGMVDKFVGDMVMAVWGGFPARGEDLVAQAFDCACKLVETARAMQYGGATIELGIGLNTGGVFMGNVGGPEKRQFTVLGQAVNMASRYQVLSASLGGEVVVGADVYARLPEHLHPALREHAGVAVRDGGVQTLYTWSSAHGGAGTSVIREGDA